MNTTLDNENNEFEHLRWSAHYTVEPAPSSLDSGDKIVLPPSALEQLLAKSGSSGSLPSPLTFELRHPHSGATIHCGVKEFSSTDNSMVQLPPWILTRLGLKKDDHVLIKLSLLPKGTFARLQPLSADYKEITDYRAALEAHLRGHYTTLTKGQQLSCHYGGRTYLFEVLELQPQDAVSITDTDLEVDMEPIKTDDTAEHSSSRSSTKKPTIVHLNTTHQANVTKGEYVYFKLVLDGTQNIDIKVKTHNGNPSIVVGSTEKPTLENNTSADYTSDIDRHIKLENISVPHVNVGIHGFVDETSVSWEATASAPDTMELDTVEEVEDHEGKVQCPNCYVWILERTLPLHQGFCLRNNVVCSWGCGKVFKKGSEEFENHWHCDQCDGIGSNKVELEKHMEYQHSPKTCVCTTFTTNSYSDLAQHRRTICPEKLITCRYCHILTAQGVVSLDSRDRLLGLQSHESYCGSRTITCQKCNKSIPIKDISVHAKIHEVKRQQQVLPPPCCNRNCIKPRAKNRLSFCQFCFGPFWITEDDPKNAKLIQRVARKIHAQLTVGCGNKWCRNKYCATATDEPKDATTAASMLIPMIKTLPRVLAFPTPNPELYFCVDESTTRKKFLAELLASESEGKYELGWCVKAIESVEEDLDRAKTWLNNNAPRKNHVL